MSMVIDSSAMLTLQFPDEDGGLLQNVGILLADAGAVTPVHWKAEIANSLVMAVRRGRISVAERTGIIADMSEFAIETDTESADQFWQSTITLCDRHKLTAYDASYLELSLRKGLPLATMDKALAASARAEGVTVFGPYA